MKKSDRRRAIRFDLKLSCRVFSPFGNFSELAGTTENISRTGMLARVPKSEPCDWGPAVGNTARIVLDLPGSTSFAPKCLECEAIVVRVGEPQDDYQDFGFRIRRMQFRNRDTLSRMLLTTAGASPGLKHLV